MKYIGTNCFPNKEVENILKELNKYPNYHNQYRIICKARGLKHANELTNTICRGIFNYDYACETRNNIELSFFENNKDITYIIQYNGGYITDIEINKILKDKE